MYSINDLLSVISAGRFHVRTISECYMTERCPDGQCVLHEQLMDDGPHYAKKVCRVCGSFNSWVPKPDRLKTKRPARHLRLVKKYGRGFCEFCGKTSDQLGVGETFHAHHILPYSDGGEPERQNILILCQACHSLCHWRRNYQ